MAGGERLARFVADRLGVDLPTANRLLEIGRATAPNRFGLRAAAFVVAAWQPLGRLLPRQLRRRALVGLLGPMLASPASTNLYAGHRLEAALARGVPAGPCES